MKERLEIDEQRMFPAGDHVIAVEIGRIEHVQESQICPLSLVEPPHLRSVAAFAGLDVLGPTVRATIENCQSPERWLSPARVQPLQQGLEVRFDGERLRLIDDSSPGAEFEDDNR